MAAPFILVHNGALVECNTTPKALVVAHPKGTYTAARTINKKSIIDFDNHAARICAISRLAVFPATESEIVSALHKSLQLGLAEFLRAHPEDSVEARITMLIAPRDSNASDGADGATNSSSKAFDLYVLCERLVPPPTPPVAVDVVRAERPNPSIKHAQWAIDRKPLEETMSKDANDVLMINNQGHFTEGISSNFFAVKRGELYTAPDELVLPGTLRSLVIKACRNLNITIHFEVPLFSEMALWEGAFICSTSRLVLAIETVHIKEENRDVTLPQSDMIERIRQEVVRIMSSEASQIVL